MAFKQKNGPRLARARITLNAGLMSTYDRLTIRGSAPYDCDSMETTKIGMVGLGTVGSGVAKLLLEHGDRIARQAGRRLELAEVVVRDVGKERDVLVPPALSRPIEPHTQASRH